MRATIYLHNDKENGYEVGEELGLTGEALKMMAYACYEVKIEGDVNPKTGEFKITHCNGRELK